MERDIRIGLGAYIDKSIEDILLREIDWNIAVYTVTQQWALVLHHKWRRAHYLSTGLSESTTPTLRYGYKLEASR